MLGSFRRAFLPEHAETREYRLLCLVELKLVDQIREVLCDGLVRIDSWQTEEVVP